MALIQPAAGRPTVSDTLNGVLITVPVPKNHALVLLGFGFVIVGGLTSLLFLALSAAEFLRSRDTYILVWLVIEVLFFGGILLGASRTIWLVAKGRELVSVTPNLISITVPTLFGTRTSSYDLRQALHFRTQTPYVVRSGPMGPRWNKHFPDGTIVFDHGMQSVTFARGVEEPEARNLLNVLREKGLITEANLA